MSTATRRALRTAVQTLLAVAAIVPVLAAELAHDDALVAVLPWVATAAPAAAAIAAGICRVMALPAVEQTLARLGLGADTAPPHGGDRQ
ncbi:hypothetical protein ACH4JZ_18295 [Streptomyces sp. NPDC017615]|uniref:hypothetical protein n=1 Tax=Streptomyces sp. NPDC017615 TaxID=3365003 RepID=UPI0037919346